MKLLAMILFLPMVALAVTVEPLPPCEYADTEVSTNMAFSVDRSMMTRIEFTVALTATPTNNVEVAIGTDANGDGNLGVEEAAYTFGYDCGKWFVRDQSKSELVISSSPSRTMEDSNIHCTTTTSDYDYPPTSPSTFTYSSHTFVLKKRKLDTAWDLVKVTRRGCGAVCELVEVKGRKPGFRLEAR